MLLDFTFIKTLLSEDNQIGQCTMKIKNLKEACPPPPAEGQQAVGMNLSHGKVRIYHGLLVHKSCCYSPATVLSLCLWFYNHNSNIDSSTSSNLKPITLMLVLFWISVISISCLLTQSAPKDVQTFLSFIYLFT